MGDGVGEKEKLDEEVKHLIACLTKLEDEMTKGKGTAMDHNVKLKRAENGWKILHTKKMASNLSSSSNGVDRKR